MSKIDELKQAERDAEARARKAYSAAFDYREKHGELTQSLIDELKSAAIAWDTARVALDNARNDAWIDTGN